MKSRVVFPLLIAFCGFLFFTDFSCFGHKDEPGEGCSENRNVVTQQGEMLVITSTMWQMSVANLNGAVLDADKNCHAQMQLEFWFKDKNLAMTPDKPPITIMFFGGGGFFDPGSVSVYSKQISDNSYLWTAFCDQAAKNAGENPIDFGIWVQWDLNQIVTFHDVELSGMINYKKYQQPE
jgi:hypothetical protein